MNGIKTSLVAAMLFLLINPVVLAADIKLELKEIDWELKNGFSTRVWSYNGSVPGTPIIVTVGERVIIEGINHLPVATNIHWHGLILPNDQDGPSRTIAAGAPFRYDFIVKEAGTYWYHSHYRPVLTQVDMGLYAPFIVKAPGDEKYSGDHTLILDDWYLDSTGKRLPGTARGDMERYGNIETVNGKTADGIPPIIVRPGELHKLRLINASTAAYHTLRLDGHRFRVTHTDGHALSKPYITESVSLVPGERIDAEIAATGEVGQTYRLSNERPELGMTVLFKYEGEAVVPPISSPFVAPSSREFPGIDNKSPDFLLELNSSGKMNEVTKNAMPGVQHQGHDMQPGGEMGDMQWTINGKTFPDTEPLKVQVGEVVKVRFWNKDTRGMHPMDHPIHVHGAKFQVVSQNGQKPEREMWKDTINVPAGQYVDVAFVMEEKGEWMLHCHILDHEDGGMMTLIIARPDK
ncbi:multicopper oxidase family protein [Azotosporobacter soli]|uniref:multicopper oxidase family protein n=1 Tax=Azotosporobacter soli TaxID=3055040 RepID=UPI0031FE5EEE